MTAEKYNHCTDMTASNLKDEGQHKQVEQGRIQVAGRAKQGKTFGNKWRGRKEHKKQTIVGKTQLRSDKAGEQNNE